MTLIPDGYTQYGFLSKSPIAYRPSLWLERREVMRRIRATRSERDLRQFVSRHVEKLDGGIFNEDELREAFFVALGVAPPKEGGDFASDWESRDAINLYQGVLLEMRFPSVANRDCKDCRKWWYDEETGKVTKKGGKPLLRPSHLPLLCDTPAGCPKGSPEVPLGFSIKNKTAFRHFSECEAVGQFPDDPIVRKNAMIIKKAMLHGRRQSNRRSYEPVARA